MLAVARRAGSRAAARRHRAAVHRLRGGRAGRRQGVRRRAAALALRLRVRPRDADRRGRHRLADLLPHRRRLPRRGRPRRHPARGRPQRRSSPPRARSPRCALGRIDGETTANVGRSQGGVGRDQRRARSLPRRRRGALARPARGPRASWPGSSTRCTTAPRRRECDVDVVVEQTFAGYKERPNAPEWSPPRPRCAPAATSRARSPAAAGRTPTRCRRRASRASEPGERHRARNHEPTERVSRGGAGGHARHRARAAGRGRGPR